MTSISRPEKQPDHRRVPARRATPTRAANDVRDRVARVRGRLPDEIDEPIVAKVEADAAADHLAARSRPTATRRWTSPTSPTASSRTGCRTCPAWPTSASSASGATRCASGSTAARLAAYGLTPQDVEDALRRQNVEVPAGRIESAAREFTVRHRDRPAHAGAVRATIVLREADGYPVRLGDVGRAELGAEDERVNVRFNGRSAVALGVVKQATANPLDVSRGGARRAAGDPAGPAGGHAARPRLRQLDLHPRIDRRGVRRPSPRRSCWWCW